METLLEIRDRIKVFVGKYEAYLMPLFKFLLTFVLMLRINSKLGFMARLTGTPIALIISLAASFLPVNLTIIILGLIVTAHVYALSMEAAIVVLALFMILFLLYYRFASQDAIATLILQVAFNLGIPAVVPVSMGLVGTPISAVSVGCGVIVRYVLSYISTNAKAIAAGGDASSKIAQFREIIDSLVGNKAMILVAVVYGMTVIVVYVIRRLSIPFCWYIAIGAGSLFCFFVLLVGNASLHTGLSAGAAFVGMLISIILNIILQFFCFSLDYNKTEKVQFEDDEYYYYVKAIPKRSSNIRANLVKPEKAPAKKVVVKVPEKAPARTARPANRTPQRPTAKNRSILGLSGGRPAGEGRLRAEAARTRQTQSAASANRKKVIEPLDEDDFN